MKKLRISSKMNLHYFPKTDIIEYNRQGLMFHKNMGFDAVDYTLSQQFLEPGWERIIDALMQHTEEIGMKIKICHLPFLGPESAQEKIALYPEQVIGAVDAAKMLGVDYAVIHPNGFTEPLEDFDCKKKFESVMRYLSPAAEHAAKTGVRLVVENMRIVHAAYPVHRYCQEPDELCEVADALGIGVCWDFGHANTCGLKQSEALAYVGARLKVLHVNDNLGIGDDHLPPFFGTVDWADAMHGLALCGFDGFLNYEINIKRLPEAVRKDHARYLVNSGRELSNMIK